MNEDGIRIEFGKALHIVSELMARTAELGRDRKEAALAAAAYAQNVTEEMPLPGEDFARIVNELALPLIIAAAALMEQAKKDPTFMLWGRIQ